MFQIMYSSIAKTGPSIVRINWMLVLFTTQRLTSVRYRVFACCSSWIHSLVVGKPGFVVQQPGVNHKIATGPYWW